MQENQNNKRRNTATYLAIFFFVTTVFFASVSFGLISLPWMPQLSVDEKARLETLKKRYGSVDILRGYITSSFYKNTDDVNFEEGMIRGLFKSLDDPYSVYYNKKEYDEFLEASSGSYGGLGISIVPAKTGYITVISTFKNSPAEAAGIEHDDKILKVNGVDYSAEQMDVAISKMKGEPGTKVTVTIRRGEKEFDLDITRAQIVIESVESRLDEESKIGYIQIYTFDDHVSSTFIEHYNDLKKKGMKAMVLDLRSNPGGSLRECVKLSDFILGEQVIVSTKDRDGKGKTYKSDAAKIDIPYVVMVNKGSASASEILVGAIKDSKSALVIGTTTFGKGLVQSVWPFGDKGGVKITTSEYFTPNGYNIHGKGIDPDIEIELPENYDAKDQSTDTQLKKAYEVLKSQMK